VDDSWQQIDELVGSDTVDGDRFGRSVGISGSRQSLAP